MAARSTRGVGELPDSWKARIKAPHIIDRLMQHIEGTIELSNTQIAAAKILLAKACPDLASVVMNAEVLHSYVMRTPEVAKTVDDWQDQNPQVTLQ